MAELVSIARYGHVALIRMQRPEKQNAVNREMAALMASALDDVEADAGVHCAVLVGVGTAFSAGADMTEAVTGIDSSGRSDGMASTIVRVARFTKPILGCINGAAYGGGALLAITCDLRIAAETAAFRFPGAAYGLVVGGSQLPRIVGTPKAKELLFTGRVVGADEALAIGLVNRVVPHADVEAETMEVAQQIAGNSLEALIATKRTVDRATEVDEAIRIEAESNSALRASPEHHARFRAAADRVAGRGGPPNT
jgi:enoyl-CoA hydratase/carnithine racemase